MTFYSMMESISHPGKQARTSAKSEKPIAKAFKQRYHSLQLLGGKLNYRKQQKLVYHNELTKIVKIGMSRKRQFDKVKFLKI